MRFYKYHGLGNDYIVLEPQDFPQWSSPPEAFIRQVCHRNLGVGSDGILWGPLPHSEASGGALRIFNPDGSEAEKSGNGLRIFCRHLCKRGLVQGLQFTIATLGGLVSVEAEASLRSFIIEMGRVTFNSADIPVCGNPREVLNERLELGERVLQFCAASIGNPHCVLPVACCSEALARELGPQIEVHPLFPRRTNVQFMQVLSRNSIRIEIWERGAGYTLASGSSSCAAAAVAHKLGLVDADVAVQMPGGCLQIHVAEDFAIRMRGPVGDICAGELDSALLNP